MLEEQFLWEGPLDEVSQRAVAHVERFKIHNALRESRWNKTRAAEKLGVSYKTLLTKIRRLGLESSLPSLASSAIRQTLRLKP